MRREGKVTWVPGTRTWDFPGDAEAQMLEVVSSAKQQKENGAKNTDSRLLCIRPAGMRDLAQSHHTVVQNWWLFHAGLILQKAGWPIIYLSHFPDPSHRHILWRKFPEAHIAYSIPKSRWPFLATKCASAKEGQTWVDARQ